MLVRGRNEGCSWPCAGGPRPSHTHTRPVRSLKHCVSRTEESSTSCGTGATPACCITIAVIEQRPAHATSSLDFLASTYPSIPTRIKNQSCPASHRFQHSPPRPNCNCDLSNEHRSSIATNAGCGQTQRAPSPDAVYWVHLSSHHGYPCLPRLVLSLLVGRIKGGREPESGFSAVDHFKNHHDSPFRLREKALAWSTLNDYHHWSHRLHRI